MKHICLYCKKEFEGRKNKLYCNSSCRENYRYHNKRKGNPEYYIKQRRRENRWYKLHGKKTKRKYQNTHKFRDYQNKWRRDKKYWLEQYEKHPETERRKRMKHAKTLKGKLSRLKSNERRRKKIWMLTGKSIEKLDPSFILAIQGRDKVCVYCGKEFNNNIKTDKETYDHLNCDEPLSLDNTLRCCLSCNSSKSNVPIEKVLEWIKRKRFIPSPIVMELLNKKIKLN
jgi:hypothetical protein